MVRLLHTSTGEGCDDPTNGGRPYGIPCGPKPHCDNPNGQNPIPGWRGGGWPEPWGSLHGMTCSGLGCSSAPVARPYSNTKLKLRFWSLSWYKNKHIYLWNISWRSRLCPARDNGRRLKRRSTALKWHSTTEHLQKRLMIYFINDKSKTLENDQLSNTYLLHPHLLRLQLSHLFHHRIKFLLCASQLLG